MSTESNNTAGLREFDGLVTVRVDNEYNADAWWEDGGFELWEELAGPHGSEVDEVTVPGDTFNNWLTKAKRILGWNDGPEYAPHPVTWED